MTKPIDYVKKKLDLTLEIQDMNKNNLHNATFRQDVNYVQN